MLHHGLARKAGEVEAGSSRVEGDAPIFNLIHTLANEVLVKLPIEPEPGFIDSGGITVGT